MEKGRGKHPGEDLDFCTEKFPECQDRSFAEGPTFRLLSASILLFHGSMVNSDDAKLSTLFHG